MMAFVHKGSGFRGTIDYILDTGGLNGKDVEVIASCGVNIPLGEDFRPRFDPSRISRSFRLQSALRPGISKPVRHLILSCPPEDLEKMTSEEWASVADEYMKRMGIVETQYLIARHREKDNPHVHIIYNVVDDEGRPLDEHNFFIRNKQVCRDITIKRNYAWGKEKAISQADINTPKARVQYALARTVTEQIYYAEDFDDLIGRLERQGIGVEIKTQEKTGRKGVVFTAAGEHGDTLCFSGRSLGSYLTYGSIQSIFSHKAGYDEAFEKAEDMLSQEAELPAGLLSENSRRLVRDLELILMEAKRNTYYCYKTFPKEQAIALSSTINQGTCFPDMKRLVSLLTPPMGRAVAAAQSHPSRKETPEEKQERHQIERSGAMDADFTETRFVEKIG
jgi:hypothetical protein